MFRWVVVVDEWSDGLAIGQFVWKIDVDERGGVEE